MSQHLSEQWERAIRSAMAKLRRTQRDGRWQAFHLYPGVSDEWVTSFVASALVEAYQVGLPGAADAYALAEAAWTSIRPAQRPDGRWGFNAATIGDADSTAWSVRLARSLGGSVACRTAVDAASAVLTDHQRVDGSVSTYAADEPIRTVIEADPAVAFDGWVGAHPCVTAVAAAVPTVTAGAVAFLRTTQATGGGWRAYWWMDDVYVAAFATEALHDVDAGAAEASASWALSQLPDAAGRDDPAFAMACIARAAAWSPTPTSEADLALDWLATHLDLRGGWPASARLRVPEPWDDAPHLGRTAWVPGGRKEGAVVLDHDGVFTTAMALSAFARAVGR